MRELAMSDAEAEELGIVLESAIRDLALEIAGTDSSEWRHLLRARRELCTRLLARLSGPEEHSAGAVGGEGGEPHIPVAR